MKDIVIAGFFFRQSAKDFLIRLRQLFCQHSHTQFIRNLYGDESIEHGWKRSLHRCKSCKAIVSSNALHR